MHITALLLPHCLPSSLALPLEMLSAAAAHARARNRTKATQHLRNTCTIQGVGMDSQPFRVDCGLLLTPDCRFDQIRHTDLLLIPTFWRSPIPHLKPMQALYPWLREQAETALICAVGTGSFLLAESGLLTGRPATTHWYYFDLFQRRYPAVDLKRNYLITEAGNLYCAGSVNSVADLTVHFIERFFDQLIARAVEAQFSPEIRRPFEQHLYAQGRDDLHGDELVIQAQELLHRSLQHPPRIHALAETLGVTERTLQRRFQRATGLTPLAYLQSQRLLTARELLRTSNLSIADVAIQVGYQDVSHFGRLFRQWMQQSPSAYRRAARGKLFSLAPTQGPRT